MADFSSLKQKVNALKAKVEQSSITPVYLGSILDDFITQMESIDMTDMSDDVRTAIANAAAAIKKADQALADSRDATDTASSAAAAVDAIIKKIGHPGGIAPLDDSSRVPLKHLPGRVDNVVEFRIIAEGIEPSEGMSHHYSGDDGCIVVFDKTTQCFLLGQPKMGQAETETAAASDSGTVIPGGTVDPGGKVDPENPWVVEIIDLSKFNFFRSWMDCVSYGTYTANGRKPEGGKIYICQTEGALYRWNGLSLVQTGGGASSGEELKELDTRMKDAEAKLGAVIGQQAGLMFVNVNGIAFVDDPYMTMEEALAAVPEEYRRSGTIVTFLKWTDESCTDAVWETYQWKGYAYTEDEWEDTSTWKRLTSCAGSGTSGEVLHVEDIPALSAADLDRIIGNTAETNL